MTEFTNKVNIIREFLEAQKIDALLLRRVSSFAWATCGAASYINTASTDGIASLLVTQKNLYLITNTIEAPRLDKEEKLAAQGWEFRVFPWHAASTVLDDLTPGLKLGTDLPYPGAIDLSEEVSRLRTNLTPEEGDRFKFLGKVCAEAMDKAIHAIRPGMTEFEIAALLDQEAQSRSAQPIVNLIATDQRIFSYRHPLPTSKKLDRYAMLVLCGRRAGLVCSITRLVHFSALPAELRRKADAVAGVDAVFIEATRPGQKINDIFQRATTAYADFGFPDEWRLHHQGGPAGYEAREYLATPEVTDTVRVGQTYAWNPSITGTKSEDTILVGDSGNEVLTTIPDWPKIQVEVQGKTISRPDILVIK